MGWCWFLEKAAFMESMLRLRGGSLAMKKKS